MFRTDSLLSLPEGIDWTRICIPDFTLPMVVPREELCVHVTAHASVLYMNSIPNKWSTVKLHYLAYVVPFMNTISAYSTEILYVFCK